MKTLQRVALIAQYVSLYRVLVTFTFRFERASVTRFRNSALFICNFLVHQRSGKSRVLLYSCWYV